MAERSIKVSLRLNAQDFKAEVSRSAKSLEELVKKSGDAGGAANTTMGKLAQSARLQSDAWNTAGTSLIGIGAAITGVNALVAKTGIEYNTLQQTSRAALETMLGSSAAVNEQMAKLDDFARTSPFSKSVFIEAQQQMLAFGIEAEKVVPYLSAINDATAAAGGNNQTLAELAFIMAQISAAGKITAQDLMQFGQRGVNAAELIGSQMGKTGAQIREDITNNALDAGDALDALAAGMSERFAGASANVKNTMEGAFDRVKAAWRDLSASIMEPAVGSSGGGFLVDMTNSVADFIRGVEALPDPVKQGAAAIGGLTGAAALAAGGFMTLVPKMMEAHTAFKALSTTFPGLGMKAGIAGLAIAGATTVIGLAVSEMGKHAAAVDEYVAILKGAGDDSEKQIRDFHAQRLAAEGVGDELERLGISARLATDAAMGDVDAREKIIDAYNREADAKRAAADASDARGEMAAYEQAQITSLETRRDGVLNLIDAERELAAESLARAEQERQMAMTSIEGQHAWGEAVRAYHTEGRAQMEATADGMRELTEAEQSWLDSVVNASSGFIDHFAALEQAQQQYAERAAVNAGESADAWQQFAESGKFALGDFAAALQEQVDAMNQWEANIIALHGKVSQSSINAIMQMGETNPELAAQVAAAMVAGTEEELRALEPLLEQIGIDSGVALHGSMEATVGDMDLAAVMRAAAAKGGDAMVAEISMKLAAGEATLGQIVASYDLVAEVDADTGPASREVTDILAWVAQQRASIDVDADTSAAERAARTALDRISAMTANMSVSASVGVYHARGLHAPFATGGHVGDAAAAYGLAAGGRTLRRPTGLLSGPGTPTSDSIPAALSTKEFVVNALATDHYGPDLMYRINSRSVNREWLRAIAGFAGGGSPSSPPPAVTPPPVASMVSRSTSHVTHITVQQVAVQGLTGAAAAEDFMTQMDALRAQYGG